MYKLYSKLGRGKQDLDSVHKSFEDAYSKMKNYCDNFGESHTIGGNKARIISNDEPILNLTIKTYK